MKTAVVIIHGVGDQKPMNTLRGFLEAALGQKEGTQPYYSKPDKLSENLELRRLQAKGRDGAHFYEYYWAHKVEGTRLVAVLLWLAGLAWRSKKDVPHSARALWCLARFMVLVLIGLLVFGVIGRLNLWFEAQAKFGVIWCAIMFVLALVYCFLVAYLGDAARYLSPRPANIRMRQEIRAEGIHLLRTLHAREEYDRIIVVGHSLGSVIGYDIITHLWPEYSESVPAVAVAQTQCDIRACLKAKTPIQPVVRDSLSKAGSFLCPNASAEKLAEFRAEQLLAFREQRRLGNLWRITDFITLGSPLVHGMLFLADSADDFEKRKLQRELPTCPPQPDEQGYAYASPVSFDIGEGKKFTPFILHDGAPFAVTRWTNMYFPARFGLFGDFVGGPIAPVFGLGVADIPVCTPRWGGAIDYTIYSHLRYWSVDSGAANDTSGQKARNFALLRLREVLELSNRGFTPARWPDFASEQVPPTIQHPPA